MRLLAVACVWLAVMVPFYAAAQSEATPRVAIEVLTQLEAELEQAKELDEIKLAELQGQLASARDWLGKEVSFNTRAAEFEAAANGAPQAVEQYREQTARARDNPPDLQQLIAEGATPEQLDSQIALLQAERQTVSQRRSAVLKQIADRPARRSEAQARLAELQREMDAGRSAPEGPAETLEQRIQHAAFLARQQRLRAESAMLEAEVLSEPARVDVSSAERDWLAQSLADFDIKLDALAAAIEAARSTASEEKLEATAALQERVRDEDPAVQALAESNRRLAEQLSETNARLEAARAEGRDMQSELESIEQSSNLMRRRLEVAGRKDVLARVMITRMNSLPDVSEIRSRMKRKNDLVADTSIAYIDTDEELRALSMRDDYLLQQGIDASALDENSARLLDDALAQRRQLLDNALNSLGSLQRLLIDNNEVAGKLIRASEDFHRFLVGNLLWVRNFTFFDFDVLGAQLRELTAPGNWLQLPQQVYGGYQQAAWGELLLVVLLLSALLSWQLRAPYRRLMRRPTPLSAESLLNMLAGILMTALIALPWPLALSCVGYFLASFEPYTPFSAAMSSALLAAGRFLFALLVVRSMVGSFGVGRRLLKWDARMLEAVRKEMRWAGPVVVLVGALERFAFKLDVVATGGPLGAMCNTALTLMVITVALRLQRQALFYDSSGVRNTLRLTAALGVAILVMQALGLLFAAETFLVSLGRTIVVLVLVKTISDVIERWLLILRGRIERKNREGKKAREDSQEDLPDDPDAWVDMVSLSSAHESLLSLGRVLALVALLWVIWAPTLPGLNLLDGFTLWQVTDSTDPTGALRDISLADLMFSVFILAVTALVAKHLPSVLQAIMLEWMNFSAGARYAWGILTQYFIIAIGSSLFLTAIGWEWSKVQWLVAALGVGIGFGLQEIVANFISGLIILFERPVRVGDVISVAGAEGTVLEIKPRATVIETFELKEVLIPNKELITGQVVNWTLTGEAVRVLIPVGVAYGSDVRRALALMLEAAREVELVLPEPEPTATFDDFGDNSLLLMLRCYVSENRPLAWTQLRNLINDKFAAEGIEISFPQRDVHLDTNRPLQIELHGAPFGEPRT